MKSPVLLLCGLLSWSFAAPLVAAEEAEKLEEGSVEWLTHMFLKDKFPERQRYYVGDMRLLGSRPTPGSTFADSRYTLDTRVNERDERSAVVAATVEDTESNQRTDFYLFFRREDDGWKISAVRNFAPPRGVGQMYAAVAARAKENKNVDPRDVRELGVLQVLQFNDWGMKQMFEKRKESFEAIAADLLKKGTTEVLHGGQPNPRAGKELSAKVQESPLNYVQLREDGIIEFNSAAFGESAVGYLWVHEKAEPPRASPEDYILVEPLGGPWYLYRRQ